MSKTLDRLIGRTIHECFVGSPGSANCFRCQLEAAKPRIIAEIALERVRGLYTQLVSARGHAPDCLRRGCTCGAAQNDVALLGELAREIAALERQAKGE